MERIEKHLQKAEKYLSRNKIEAAIDEYKAAHELQPQDLELLSTLADLLVRANRKEESRQYYGKLFDKYAEKGDATRAVSIYRRSLQDTPQLAGRQFQLARLLERADKKDDAVKVYRTAADQFAREKKNKAVLDCLGRIAALKPDDADVQMELGKQATRLGHAEVAARAFLRAGQLRLPEDLRKGLELLERAYQLSPADRTVALFLGQALVSDGDHKRAVELLLPLYTEKTADPAVLQTLAGALLAAQRLTEAEEVLEAYYRAQPDSYEKLFELADLYCKAGQPEKSIEVLKRLREHFSNAQREKEFLERVETLYDLNEAVVPLAEFIAGLFDEANLESRYAQVLGKLFGVYLAAGDAAPAADVLERLIDLDPYDFENQQRLEQLKGKLDDTRFRAVASRITSAATVTGQATVFSQTGGQMAEAADDPQKKEAVLEDLIVQVEIFLQYSLKTKAIEKLGKLHELFPGEEARNARLYKLYEEAQFFPPGFAESPPRGGAPTPAAPAAPAPSADAVSHLAKISEITHTLFRQRGPKEILQAAVAELGKYLRASRCLGVLGRPGKLPSVTVEFCAPGVPQSPRAAVVRLLALLGKVKVDSETGVVLDAELSPELKQVGAKSVLAMPLIEKEKQEPVGLLVLSQTDSLRQWNPNEVYLLKAVADQVETAVSHTKLRSLMKTMTVADDGTGLLRRSSYLDTLVAEVGRHKTQGTSLVVVLLELDKGASLLHRVGEATMEKFMREASTIVLGQTRQNDLAFWYSATALALVLGDTTAKQCQPMVEKLRQGLLEVKLPGVKDSPSFSAAISEAAIRPDYDEPDIVTDVINRAEFTLEEARKKGNAVAVW